MAKRYHSSKTGGVQSKAARKDMHTVASLMPAAGGTPSAMPTSSFIKMYPKCEYMNVTLPDNITGIDKQKDGDVSGAKRQLRPAKVS